jgi:hypothetical protein
MRLPLFLSATNVPTNNETQTTTERAGITKIFLARKEFAALSRTPQHRKKLSDIGG